MLMNSGNEEATAAIANNDGFVAVAGTSEKLQAEVDAALATGFAAPNLAARLLVNTSYLAGPKSTAK
jgi:hypothetical protein